MEKNVNTKPDEKKELRKKRRKTIAIVISVILLLFSLVTVIQLRKWIKVSPGKPFAFENVYCVTKDKNGNMYIVDNSNTRIIKLDAEGKLEWKREASDKTFSSINNITCDDAGNVYILDVTIERGVRIASEGIVAFSSEGEFLGKIKTWTYNDVEDKDNYDDDRMRASIVGLKGVGDSVTYIRKIDEKLYIADGKGSDSKEYDFPNLEDTVLSCTIDDESGRIWYTTYDGRLLEYVDGVNDTLLYTCDEVEGSVLKNVSYGDGKVYVADIGLRNILAVDVETGDKSILEFEEPAEEREITYVVNADNGLVSASSYSVSRWDDVEIERLYEVPLNDRWNLLTTILRVALCILALNILFDVVMFIIYIFKKASLYTKIIFAIIVGVVGMGGLFLGSVYPNFQSQLRDSMYSRENLAATVTADRIPKDAFLRLSKPSDFKNDDYKAVESAIESVFLSDTEDAKDLYCSLYRVIDGTITLTYSLESVCVVYPYDWDYEGSDEQAILTTGEGKTYISRSSSGSFIFVLEPIFDDEGNAIGLIEVGKDLAGFEHDNKSMLFTLIINIIAMTTVVIMFVIEMFYYIAGKRSNGEKLGTAADNIVDAKTSGDNKTVPAEILRFVTFLICFVTNLTTAILPIYAMRIANRGVTFGLSSEVLAAIPISAEVVACAICSLLGSRVIKKIGGKTTTLMCSILITVGLALRVIPSIWVLSLSAVILGAGWGTLVLMINIMITALPEDERDKGFAFYSAAGFSGANCGILFGGFLIQWIPYSALFALSAVISIALIFVTKKYLAVTEVAEDKEEKKASGMSTFKLITNPKIFAFFIMMLVPAAIVGYYLNYMYPILGEEWGLSETYIGYSYLINGMCVVAFGEILTKLFSKKKRLGLALSSFVYALAFVVVVTFHNIPALFGALALVGISDGFGNPLMTGFFTDLPEVKKYGYDRAFGIYSIFENVAQSAGSFVFSYVLIMGVTKGLSMVALILAILTFIFLLSGIFDRKSKSSDDAATD